MYKRIQMLTETDFNRIHAATLEVFRDTGIVFHEPEALEIFKHHGVRVEGRTVHLEAAHIEKALASAPSQFRMEGRNPDKSVVIGGDQLVFTPGYGSPFMMDSDGEKRQAVMADYENFCKLVQTSKTIDMCGCLMVDPSDRPAASAHLDQMQANLTLCDKPCLGSVVSRRAAIESIAMAAIAFGGMDQIKDRAVLVGIISSLSPLQYSEEMAGALIEYARHGQANMCGLLMQAGATGPVTLPGLLVVQNAEILAGVVLTQLVNPGAPVIYGTTSTITEMRTGALAIGAPELSMIQNASMQMAQFYGLPSRGSGGISDSHCADFQAGVESTMALTSTIMSGANFILHACGTLGSYLAMSYEKFMGDEEICGMLRRMLQPLAVTDARIDIDTIKDVGAGGEYLTHPSTYKHCRSEFYMPSEVIHRRDYDSWLANGKPRLDQRATKMFQQRIAAYEQPAVDPEIESALSDYVKQHRD